MTPASNKVILYKKLKDSCTACAVAKVKCNREKPICTRCQDRSFMCFYEVSQRSGRKSTASLANKGFGDAASKNKSSPSPPRDHSPCRAPNPLIQSASSSTATAPKTDIEPLKDCVHGPLQDSSLGCFGMVDFSPQPTLQTFNFDIDFGIDMENCVDFDSFLPISPPPSSTLSADTFQSTASSSWASNSPLFARTSTKTSSSRTPQANTWTSAPASSAAESQPFQAFSGQTKTVIFPPVLEKPTDMMDICCLSKMSQILTELRGSKSRCAASPMDNITLDHDRHTVAQIIVANRRHFQNTVDVLNCTCAGDRHILFMIALIIFSIIAEYGEAVRSLQQPEQNQVLINLGRMPQVAQTQSPRLGAHLILGELYRVIRMIELFANVHRQMQTDGEMGTLACSNPPRQACHDDAIPVSMFGQMEADLRERLQMARENTLDILRQF